MNEAVVTCPSCGNEVKLNETLAAPIIAAERKKIESELRVRAEAVDTREKTVAAERSKLAEQAVELQRRQASIDEQVAERLRAGGELIAKEASRKATDAAAAELNAAKDALAAKDAKLAEAQKAELEVRKQQEALEQDKREFDLRLSRAVDEERERVRTSIRAEESKKATDAVAAKLKAAEVAVAEKDARLAEAQKAELEIRKDRQALEDEKRSFDLKLARAVDDERNLIREATRKEDDEQYRLKIAEKDKVIEDVKKQLEEARRKSEQGSQQLQGEVQELDLEAILRDRFPQDVIEPVAKGQRGGDVLQRVYSASGSPCGSILWESKRTKAWQDPWLSKARDNQRDAKADLVVILSTVLPKGVDPFDQSEGVWITKHNCALPLAAALRQTLIETASARKAMEGRHTKMDIMYSYLTAGQFKARVSALAEAYINLRTDLDSERRAITKLWSKREKQLERMLGGMVGMYGELQGIVGASLPEIEGLTLPMLEGPSTVENDGDPDVESVSNRISA